MTTWSKFGMTFDRRLGRHAARRSPARCRRPRTCWRPRHTGYTTNLPLADVTGGKAWVAWEVDGEPLPAEHGGPARLLVPHLYFWKSAKWVARAARCSTTTSPASGSATATTTAAIPGSSSATRATETCRPRCTPIRRGRRRRVVGDPRRDARGPRRSGSRCPQPAPHRAGQHYVVRLTAPDGYTARARTRWRRRPTAPTRSSSPSSGSRTARCRRSCTTCVRARRRARGARPDRRLVRLGRRHARPCSSAAGPGVVPLMAMLRLARDTGRTDLVRLVVSVRTPDDLYYARRAARPGDDGRLHPRRRPPGVAAARRAARGRRPRAAARRRDATAYVCGSAGFADAASELLVEPASPVERIRVERFGPTG